VVTIWVAYVVVAVIASGVFLVAGLPSDPLWDEPEINADDAEADAGAALRLALKRLSPVMANRNVQAELAVAVGLRVRMRSAALAELLEEMLSAAIHAAPASRILLTAAAQGDQIAICITDDIPNADADVRRAGVRRLMERTSLRGGALDIDVRREEGTTMTLRLVAATDRQEARTLPNRASSGGSTLIPQVSFDMSR
jgi:signal transduction histidine kinase